MGLLDFVNLTFTSLNVAAGNAPNAVLTALVPGFIGALELIYTAFTAWRE